MNERCPACKKDTRPPCPCGITPTLAEYMRKQQLQQLEKHKRNAQRQITYKRTELIHAHERNDR